MIKKIISLALGFAAGSFFVFGLVMGALGKHIYSVVDFIASATIVIFLFWQIFHRQRH